MSICAKSNGLERKLITFVFYLTQILDPKDRILTVVGTHQFDDHRGLVSSSFSTHVSNLGG